MKKYRVYESDVKNGYKITGTENDPIITIVDEQGNYLKGSSIYNNIVAFKEDRWYTKKEGVFKHYLHKLILEFDTLEELQNHFMEYLIWS